MDELLYKTLDNYYKTLSISGYKEDSVVYKILVLQYIQEIFDKFKDCITDKDIKIIQNLINQFTTSTCEIPFLEQCNYSK